MSSARMSIAFVEWMFEACISEIIAYDDNLVAFAYDTGVVLGDALSVLATASRNLWNSGPFSAKLGVLERILDAALERDKMWMEEDNDGGQHAGLSAQPPPSSTRTSTYSARTHF